MKLRFLCANHRKLLAQKPEQAIHCWQNGFETGQWLCEQRRWDEALSHVGCAYEAADIVLSSQIVAADSAYELFVSSTCLLVETLAQLGEVRRAADVYEMTVQRLMRDAGRIPELQGAVLNHLDALNDALGSVEGVEKGAKRVTPQVSPVRVDPVRRTFRPRAAARVLH